MWKAWVAWVVNGTMLNFFFNVFIVSMVVFIVVFKISCVCNVPSFQRHKSVARSSFDKTTCTTSIFGMCKCLCEDLNITISRFQSPLQWP